MTRHIFTYGSLMFADVWQRVVSRPYSSSAAELHEYARYAVIGETYPGLVREPGASVNGVLYFDVLPEDVLALDRFEGPDYRRDTVVVHFKNGSVEADTYLFCKSNALAPVLWDPESFDKQSFIRSYCGMPSK